MSFLFELALVAVLAAFVCAAITVAVDVITFNDLGRKEDE